MSVLISLKCEIDVADADKLRTAIKHLHKARVIKSIESQYGDHYLLTLPNAQYFVRVSLEKGKIIVKGYEEDMQAIQRLQTALTDMYLAIETLNVLQMQNFTITNFSFQADGSIILEADSYG